MKIAPRASELFLRSVDTQSRALLLYGPDSGLVRERANAVRKQLLGASDDPFAYTELENAKLIDDPARLSDELRAVSLLSPLRLIIIRDASDKLSAIVREAIPALSKHTYLVLLAEELSTRSSLRMLFEQEPSLAVLACYRDEARDIASLARQAFAKAQVSADSDAIDYLAQQLGNDRGVTQSEIEKIVIFAGKSGRISLEEMQSLVDYNRDASLDDVAQAIADRNLQSLEAALQVHWREGTQAIAYLRALTRYFHRLYAIRARMDDGENLDAIVAGLKPKVFFRQEPILKRHAQSWTIPQLAKAISLLIAAELACKTSDLPAIPASHRRLMQVTQTR